MIAEKITRTNIHTWLPENSVTKNFQFCDNHNIAANGKSLLIGLAADRHVKTACSSILQEKLLKKMVTSATVKFSPVNGFLSVFTKSNADAFNIAEKINGFFGLAIHNLEFKQGSAKYNGVCL